MFYALAVVAALVAGSARAEPPEVGELVRRLETGTPGERVTAAEQLRDLGPRAAEAVPALGRVAQAAHRGSKVGDAEVARANKYLYTAAVEALAAAGPKAAAALVELMPGESDDWFGSVAWHVGSLGPDAAPVVPALAKLLASDDQGLRVQVARALERIGPAAEPAVPALVDLFFNPKNKEDNRFGFHGSPPPPRLAAVQALVRIGPKATPALRDKVVPALAEELRTGKEAPGGRTDDLVTTLGEAGGPLVPAVIAEARKDDPRVRWEDAGQMLLGLGATGRRAFGELLAGDDAAARRGMVEALKWHLFHERQPKHFRCDPPRLDVGPFVPGLVAALKDPDPKHRLAAAERLSDHPDKVPAAARDAILALPRDPAVQKWLGENGSLFDVPHFGRFGEPGHRALIAPLDVDSVPVRRFVLWQLRSRERSAAALPKVRKLIDHPDTALALHAADTAARLSLDPKDAAALARPRFVRSEDPEIRADAAHGLRYLGPLGAPHLDSLVPLLDDKDEKVFQAAADAIHAHAPKGSAAARALAGKKVVPDDAGRFVPAKDRPERKTPTVAELIVATTGGDDWKRPGAALELGDRGAAAQDAAPALKKLLLDPDPDLRFAAAYALARIGDDVPALRRLLAGAFERLAAGRPASRYAGAAFERLPPKFPELLPLVVRVLEREPFATTLLAGLAKYGPRAAPAVPGLRKALRGPESPGPHWFAQERSPAIAALAAVGPAARDALPDLRGVLDSDGVELALAARDAIRKITGGN